MEKQKLVDIPSLEVSNPGILMFACNTCQPKITFTDIEAHTLHSIEIHNRSVSYKNIMIRHYGVENCTRWGLTNMAEIQVVDMIVRFNAQMSKRK